jgi:hypothetical protein
MEKYVSFRKPPCHWSKPFFSTLITSTSGLEVMRALVARYAGGYEAWAEEHRERAN